MLRITIPLSEVFNEETSEFGTEEGVTLDLEHSLVSLSKWESKWEKPFLSNKELAGEEFRDYIRMMILGENPPEEALSRLTAENYREINDYMNAKMTATWFSSRQEPVRNQEIVTAEVIYYSMTALGIPFECQYWHLNRLLTLIRVCNAKNQKPRKMSRNEVLAQQRELNNIRRQQTGSRG